MVRKNIIGGLALGFRQTSAQVKDNVLRHAAMNAGLSRSRPPRSRQDFQLDYQRCFFVNIRLRSWHAVLSSVSLRYGL